MAVADVLTAEDEAAGGVDDPLGNRRIGGVGAIGEQAEDEEAEKEDDYRRLKPDLRNDQLALVGYLIAPFATRGANLTIGEGATASDRGLSAPP